jgi:hypothetical protein
LHGISDKRDGNDFPWSSWGWGGVQGTSASWKTPKSKHFISCATFKCVIFHCQRSWRQLTEFDNEIMEVL